MSSSRRGRSTRADVGAGMPLTPDLGLDDDIADGSSSREDLDLCARPKDIPEHPIPSMQRAFAESYIEATTGAALEKPRLRTKDAKARREELLDQEEAEEAPGAMWRFRPGQTCHELRKLMAQVSFGVYLLLNGLANSNAQVVSILQGHIDEIDEFLEMAMEDIDLAKKDLSERIDFLKLPMDNMQVFTTMLEDRAFRLQIVEGNAKIEHILARTTTSIVQSAQDVGEGLKSTREFTAYLASEEGGVWRSERPDVVDIFDAMRGNTEGWLAAFVDLQSKISVLNALVLKLENTVALINRTAGKVSRLTRFSIQPFTTPEQQSRPPSEGSFESATPPASSPPRISAAPPRLSLRFSRMPDERPSGPTYFDLPLRNSLFPTSTLSRDSMHQSSHPVAGHEPSATDNNNPESPLEHMVESGQDAGSSRESKLSIGSTVRPDSPTDGGGLYLLQPRTYTPIPPAPLPSPRVIEEDAVATNVQAPRASDSALAGRRLSSAPSRSDPRADGIDQLVLSTSSFGSVRGQARILKVSSPRILIEPEDCPGQSGEIEESTRSVEQSQLKRTSLRQRVSLKTNPPESIQVPPPNAPELQRPVFASPRTYQAYETFVAPDSAYGSDNERTAVNSVADPSATGFSPPSFPGLIPSPHSDQQYFRPVQASPHSPLQQRPHTSGTAGPRYLHQRNAPSAMGMSMLSSVSTLSPDTAGGRTLKKKRSAFGWLKKAFSLDEEERMAYEQRKNEHAPNLYYDGRSPKFLDGKRLR